MDFQLSKAQKEIQKAAREFAKGKFDKDAVLEADKNQAFPEDIRRQAAELGFIGIHYPEKYNGSELGVFENALLAEALCQVDSGTGLALMLSGFSAECLLRFAADDLKAQWLPAVADGRVLSGAAFTEAAAGERLDAVQTLAREEGGEWVLSGSKAGVLNAGAAGFYCVLCRTEPDADPAKDAVLILVEADRPGLYVQNPREKLGMRMTATADLEFEGVRVPAQNRIGRTGDGLKQAFKFHEEAWILIAALALGTARGAFGRALDYAKKREQFGRPLARFQVTRHKIAELAARIEETAAFVYSAADSFDRGKSSPAAAAMAKLRSCRTALAVTSEAIQLLGGYGYMKEYEVERFYRDVKAMSLFCGSEGYLKDVIAGSVIGKMK